MLYLTIPKREYYDDEKEEFVVYEGCVLTLEHSLVSLSKWESKWKTPFLTRQDKTEEETIDYIRCMTIGQNVDPEVYIRLTKKEITQVLDYIQDSMSATKFKDQNQRPTNEIITAEIIYYWMVSFQIPFECQKWHLNRLLTLIKICSIKNKPSKNMSRRDLLNQYKSLNAQRKAALNTTG